MGRAQFPRQHASTHQRNLLVKVLEPSRGKDLWEQSLFLMPQEKAS